MTVEKRIITTTTILLLLTAAVIGLVIIPSINGINRLTDEITAQQSEIEQRYLLRNYARRITADTDAAAAGLDELRLTYVIEGEELDFIQSMERSAGLAGVIQEISLETANEIEINRWEKQIPLKIKIQGSLPQIMSWLNEIEHLDNYVIIDSLIINTQRGSAAAIKSGNVDAYLTGHIFWLSKSAPYVQDFRRITAIRKTNEDTRE
ncbi:hypothetical protein A2480_01155 [Candidatus Uhrbacteria bacterium RIFOXYC2_FULL_47_19]|uniref:Uncharacterized protein n=1 Tax=Candidatus Uhrbacteria bacterium RIFOXYC2_FULL_47_19 TaxID=1802424 RepID=A0A1F7WDC1_9BACT|nr:MAG: hypothetical protein A2480_01155 [Candidatus Uhrbacteria bacterium RIFOXYC2_FULL_47_19]HCC22057.1 hypothetical protein [Candidatus Uhrbacteria bacterium]